MTDEEAAKAVRDALGPLNAALVQAGELGLKVTLDYDSFEQLGRGRFRIYTAQITRETVIK